MKRVVLLVILVITATVFGFGGISFASETDNLLVAGESNSVISDYYRDGARDGKQITSSGSGVIADYRLGAETGLLDSQFRIEIVDGAFLTDGSYIEFYMSGAQEECRIRLTPNTVGYAVKLVLNREGTEEVFALGTTQLAQNEYGDGQNVFAAAMKTVADIQVANRNNFSVKFNYTEKQLRGKDGEENFIEFFSENPTVSVGIRCYSAVDSTMGIILKQLGNAVFYEYGTDTRDLTQDEEDIGYSKVYLKWENVPVDGATGMILQRYDSEKANLLFSIAFPTVERSYYNDSDLEQGTQYVYEIRLVDSVTIATPKVVLRYRDIRVETKKGTPLNIITVIVCFFTVSILIVLIYAYLPDIKKLLRRKKKSV
ncbi:MAG: hypothetical protein ACI4S9_00320 [Christensenellales bacterium]